MQRNVASSTNTCLIPAKADNLLEVLYEVGAEALPILTVLPPLPPTYPELHEHRDESTRPERGDPQDAPLPQHRDREHQKASGNAGEPGSCLQGSAQLSTQA